MARRRPLRYTLILAGVALSAVLAAAGGWRYARASAPLSGPIVVVSIDTLRADHLPPYGYAKIRTPAIELLASNGVVFERAYSHAAETLPAHVALLSGRLPFETGVRGASGERVRPGERLLSQMLRERGYATAGIVSSSVLAKDSGIAQGFDFFDDNVPPAEPMPAAAFTERDGSVAEQAAERWLDSIGTSRAFLFLHLDEPHAPYAAPSRFSGYAPYDAEIVYADEILGKLVHYLKSHQLYDRSTIVLLSDHGEGLGDHGEREHGLFAYGDTIHVPFIIKQEGNEGAGRRVTDIVQHIDLVPTILDLVKAPAPGALRGRSLKPLLEGRGKMPDRQVYSEALYAHSHFGWSELAALTDGRYQYVRAPREELYDLSRDPQQRTNLLDAGHQALAPDVARALTELRGALERLLPPPRPIAAEAGETLVDPKDRRQFVDGYRGALDAASQGEWPRAIAQLQQLLHADSDVAEAWSTLAGLSTLMSRYDLALDAYHQVVTLRPSEPSGYLGSADVLFRQRKFDDARVQGLAAVDRAADTDTRTRASAHELLARIALARRDINQAQVEAGLAHQADPSSVMPAFVDARALYDQGKFDDALPIFEDATTTARKGTAPPLENLHFYTGDTLQHLDRPSEAEYELLEELRYFPHNMRAATALIALYQMQGRVDEAEDALTRILKTTPTPEAYTMASRMLKAMGDTKRSNLMRTEAARLFPVSRARATAGH